ncbi:MAG: hypothetical protein ACRD0V_18175 [Acidimicrobiales bacterium]
MTPKTGAAVSGTLTCSLPAQVFIEGFASQRAGRVKVQGSFFAEVDHDGSAAWTADLVAFNGRFVGGYVSVDVFAFGFDGQQDDDAQASAVMRLKGRRLTRTDKVSGARTSTNVQTPRSGALGRRPGRVASGGPRSSRGTVLSVIGVGV